MSSTNDSSTTVQRGRYVQPLNKVQILYLLAESDRNGEEKLARLRDEWGRDEFNSRTDAMRRTVYDIAWYADHDPDVVMDVIRGSALFKNWSQGEREVRMFVGTSKVEDPGHYSIYPHELEDATDGPVPAEESDDDEPDSPPTGLEPSPTNREPTPQHRAGVPKSTFVSDYDQHCRDLKRDLFGK